MDWPLEDDPGQLSAILEALRSDGPQTITRDGAREAVVISTEEYDRLNRRKPTFVEFLLSGPEWDDEFVAFVNARDQSPPREFDFDE